MRLERHGASVLCAKTNQEKHALILRYSENVRIKLYTKLYIMKEKSTSNNSASSSGKGRRTASLAAQGSSQKDVLRTGSSKKLTNSADEDANSLQWSSFDSSILHAYRYDYRLDTPAAFKKPYNHIALSRSPIGKYSPTMAGKRDQRRQSKDQLAAAVRNHFKCMGIVENDVVVEFLYKVHYQDKSFRMRFAPKR